MAVYLPNSVTEARYIDLMDNEAYDPAVVANDVIFYTGTKKHEELSTHGSRDPNVYMPAFKNAIKEAKRSADASFSYSFTDFSEDDFRDIVAAIKNRYTEYKGSHIAAVKIERRDGDARALIVVHFADEESAAAWQKKYENQEIDD